MKTEYVGVHSALNADFKPLVRYHQICYNCGQDFLHQQIHMICNECGGVQIDNV